MNTSLNDAARTRAALLEKGKQQLLKLRQRQQQTQTQLTTDTTLQSSPATTSSIPVSSPGSVTSTTFSSQAISEQKDLSPSIASSAANSTVSSPSVEVYQQHVSFAANLSQPTTAAPTSSPLDAPSDHVPAPAHPPMQPNGTLSAASAPILASTTVPMSLPFASTSPADAYDAYAPPAAVPVHVADTHVQTHADDLARARAEAAEARAATDAAVHQLRAAQAALAEAQAANTALSAAYEECGGEYMRLREEYGRASTMYQQLQEQHAALVQLHAATAQARPGEGVGESAQAALAQELAEARAALAEAQAQAQALQERLQEALADNVQLTGFAEAVAADAERLRAEAEAGAHEYAAVCAARDELLERVQALEAGVVAQTQAGESAALNDVREERIVASGSGVRDEAGDGELRVVSLDETVDEHTVQAALQATASPSHATGAQQASMGATIQASPSSAATATGASAVAGTGMRTGADAGASGNAGASAGGSVEGDRMYVTLLSSHVVALEDELAALRSRCEVLVDDKVSLVMCAEQLQRDLRAAQETAKAERERARDALVRARDEQEAALRQAHAAEVSSLRTQLETYVAENTRLADALHAAEVAARERAAVAEEQLHSEQARFVSASASASAAQDAVRELLRVVAAQASELRARGAEGVAAEGEAAVAAGEAVAAQGEPTEAEGYGAHREALKPAPGLDAAALGRLLDDAAAAAVVHARELEVTCARLQEERDRLALALATSEREQRETYAAVYASAVEQAHVDVAALRAEAAAWVEECQRDLQAQMAEKTRNLENVYALRQREAESEYEARVLRAEEHYRQELQRVEKEAVARATASACSAEEAVAGFRFERQLAEVSSAYREREQRMRSEFLAKLRAGEEERARERREWERERAKWAAAGMPVRPAALQMDAVDPAAVATPATASESVETNAEAETEATHTGDTSADVHAPVASQAASDATAVEVQTQGPSETYPPAATTPAPAPAPVAAEAEADIDAIDAAPQQVPQQVSLHFAAEDALSDTDSGDVPDTQAAATAVHLVASAPVEAAERGLADAPVALLSGDAPEDAGAVVPPPHAVTAIAEASAVQDDSAPPPVVPRPRPAPRPALPAPAVPGPAAGGLLSRVFGWWSTEPLSAHLSHADGELVVATKFVLPQRPPTPPAARAGASAREIVPSTDSAASLLHGDVAPSEDGAAPASHKDAAPAAHASAVSGSPLSGASVHSFHVALPSGFLDDADAEARPDDAIARATRKSKQTKFSYALPALPHAADADTSASVSGQDESAASPALSLTSFLSEEALSLQSLESLQ